MTAMVGEFPELQGTMGRYYAAAQGEAPEVALAIEQHYRPRYAGDELPTERVGQALALADKIDTLVGIFAIEQRPTGTKDPFGLRRAALGVLRILLEGQLDLELSDLLEFAAELQPVRREGVALEVSEFITDRLRGLLLERGGGITVEMIDAVLAVGPLSPLDVDSRLTALKEFLMVPDAGVLAALNKRIVNILRKAPPGDEFVRTELLDESAERQLHTVQTALQEPVRHAIAERRYADALGALIQLRAGVDAFFDEVMVMDENLERRQNRLALLRAVQRLLAGVADLSRLPG
jgi:glycyl-tRNA synthetase beta chain